MLVHGETSTVRVHPLTVWCLPRASPRPSGSGEDVQPVKGRASGSGAAQPGSPWVPGALEGGPLEARVLGGPCPGSRGEPPALGPELRRGEVERRTESRVWEAAGGFCSREVSGRPRRPVYARLWLAGLCN